MNIKVLSAVVLVPLAVAGCTKSSMSPDSGKEAKEYTVTLACGGEIKDVSISDLTKAEESNDLYGVQVYSRPTQSENEYKPYAYGLFDSMEGREIKLLEGYEYKFVVTMVKDGKAVIANTGGYWSPFNIEIDKPLSISESFSYDNNRELQRLAIGQSHLKQPDGIFSRPNITRYYGEVVGYIPSEGGKVTISMKRTVFGLKVKARISQRAVSLSR